MKEEILNIIFVVGVITSVTVILVLAFLISIKHISEKAKNHTTKTSEIIESHDQQSDSKEISTSNETNRKESRFWALFNQRFWR